MIDLSLRTLGPFQATLSDKPLTDFRTRKVQALLVFLATERDAQRRERLLDLLWPGLPERSARSNLRQILYYLRQAIPDVPGDGKAEGSLLIATRQTIALNPAAGVEVDAHRFEALLAKTHAHDHVDLYLCRECKRHVEEAVALYRGPFLADIYLDDSNEFEEWAQTRREYFRRKALDALGILTRIAIRVQDYATAQTYAERQLEIDSLRESGYRQLMEVLARSGRREQAVAVYESCRRVLAEELGMAPAARTTEIYEKIVAGDLRFDTFEMQGVRGYELKEQIGEGTHGAIHRAIQTGIGREVAVKVIRRQHANDPEFIRRFEAEAQIVARLEHPYIVPLYDYWRDPDGAYLVMRYMRQGSLLSALASGPWQPTKAAELLSQVAGALAVAHRHDVIHRDIKPGNILLDEAGNAYLSDFGIARDRGQVEQVLGQTAVLGTLDYTSPEQIVSGEVTPQSDIYSLGVVLYETLTGEKPFGRASVASLLHNQLHTPIPFVTASRPDIPVEIDTVIQKATAKKPAERYASVLEMATAFRNAVGDLQAPVTDRPRAATPALTEIYNPYKGLRAFQEVDADDFFGREELVQRLLDRLAAPANGRESRFLAVVGPSGSGKSSVVKAGLIPALRAGAVPGSENWFIAEMTPGTHPLEELEQALWPVAVEAPPDLVEPMARDTRGMLRTIRRILPDEPGAQLLLVIDQFEELFTLVEEEERRAFFLDSLLAAIHAPRSPLRVVITLRADFYDRPLQLQEWGQLLKENTEIVLPLNHTELTWAIREPARRVGVSLEEGLTSVIVSDVAEQPGALPLLQYAMTELFESREGRFIRSAAYKQLGRVQGALGRRAEAVFAELDGDAQQAARQMFLRLITLGEGAQDTRRRVLRSELQALAGDAPAGNGRPSPMADALDRFGAARFLTFDHDPLTRAPTVEVAHEALIREWPRLRGWLAESRNDVRLQRVLAQAAGEWQAASRAPGYLLRESRLNQFAGWAASASVALTEDERTFVGASMAAREQRRAAEEERWQRELQAARDLADSQQKRAEEQARAARRLRRRAVYLAGALLVATVLAVLALGAGRQAQVNAGRAQDNADLAVANAGEAQANANVAATKAAESAANAALAQTREAEESLQRAAAEEAQATAEAAQLTAKEQADLATSRELSLAALNTLPLDPELSILLALQAVETAYTQAAEDALHQAVQQSRLRYALPGALSAAYNPDGARVATVNGTDLQIWELASNRPVLTVTLPAESHIIAYSPDGGTIATGHLDGRVIIWDAATGGEHSTLSSHTGAVNAIDFSPDGRLLASSDGDGEVILWDLASGEARFTFPGVVLWATHVAFSPDGVLLAVPELGEGEDTDNGTVNLYDTDTGDLQLTILPPTTPLLAFSPDGASLATAAGGHGVSIWDLPASLVTGEAQQVTTLSFHAAPLLEATFSPDGSFIATSSQNGATILWDPRTGEEQFALAGHTGGVYDLGFSSDGQSLLTVANDGARVWDVSLPDNEEVMALMGPDVMGELAMALSPDGAYMALGGTGGEVHLRDAASGRLLAILAGHKAGVFQLVFSPDGNRLATAGNDGVVIVWDVAGSLASALGQELLRLEGHDASAVIGGNFTGVLDVAYSPDGARLATAGADGTMRLWDAASGQLLQTLEVHPGGAGVWTVAFSPDGQYLAAGSELPAARVWRLTGDDLEELYTLTGFPSRITSVTFDPDGTRLLTTGADTHMALWDALSGEAIRSYSGHASGVIRATFSPDGRTMATGSNDATIRLWDVDSGNNLLTFATAIPPWDMAFSPDGATLYASTRGGELRVYALALERLVELAHSRLTRWFTPEECLQYLHTDSCPPDARPAP